MAQAAQPHVAKTQNEISYSQLQDSAVTHDSRQMYPVVLSELQLAENCSHSLYLTVIFCHLYKCYS